MTNQPDDNFDVDEVNKVRQSFYSSLGTVDPYVLTGFTPVAQAYPRGHRALVQVRNGDTTIVITEGLSDATNEFPVGMSAEVLMATKTPLTSIAGTWLSQAALEMADLLAQDIYREDIKALIGEIGPVSCGLSSVRDIPAEYISETGHVGVILGIKSKSIPETIQLPTGEAAILILRLLKADELAEIVSGGGKARERLVKQFESEDFPHLEDLSRPSYASAEFQSAQTQTVGARRAQLPLPPGPATDMICATGLNSAVTEDELRGLFSQHGTVVSIKIMMGMAFVKMDSATSSEKAVQALNGHFVHKQPIQLTYAKSV